MLTLSKGDSRAGVKLHGARSLPNMHWQSLPAATSVASQFRKVAECVPLVVVDGSLSLEARRRTQSTDSTEAEQHEQHLAEGKRAHSLCSSAALSGAVSRASLSSRDAGNFGDPAERQRKVGEWLACTIGARTITKTPCAATKSNAICNSRLANRRTDSRLSCSDWQIHCVGQDALVVSDSLRQLVLTKKNKSKIQFQLDYTSERKTTGRRRKPTGLPPPASVEDQDDCAMIHFQIDDTSTSHTQSECESDSAARLRRRKPTGLPPPLLTADSCDCDCELESECDCEAQVGGDNGTRIHFHFQPGESECTPQCSASAERLRRRKPTGLPPFRIADDDDAEVEVEVQSNATQRSRIMRTFLHCVNCSEPTN